MKRYLFSLFLFSYLLVNAQEKPNFIFILTDDQSYQFMGCTGNEFVKTPNLDQLANDGVLFTNAHCTSAICTPSRISILLSQYERKHGVNFNSGTSVNETAWNNSYPILMRKAGYYTGWIGKNHSPIGKGGYESGLMEKSFDYWYAGHGHLGFYPKKRHKIFKDAEFDTQIEVVDEGVDDFLTPQEKKLKRAITFIDTKPEDQPFMLSINLNLPHGAGTRSMMLKDTDDDLYKTAYRDITFPLPQNYVAKTDIKTPKLPADLLKVENRQTGYDIMDTPEGFRERYTREMQTMTGIDRMVGNIIKKLKKEKLYKNTVIFFTSDHGLFHGQFGLSGKALCYEQTTHVPMFVFDPRTPKKQRGIKTNALAQTIDIAPTMLSMAGISVPETFQGKNLTPLLKKQKQEIRDYIFTENLWSTQFGNPRCEAVQNKEWKYIRYYKNENFPALEKIKTAKLFNIPQNKLLYKVSDLEMAIYRHYSDTSLEGEPAVYEELYHLTDDPTETTNLVKETKYANVLDNLRKIWLEELTKARGTGKPQVFRYTYESRLESGVKDPKGH